MSVPQDLVDSAARARANAYAPYSGYHVGAAIRGANGKIYSGCNVENVSFGITLCAERAALGAMVADGETGLKEIVVLTRDGGSPCGMCRQALAEFAQSGEVQVHMMGANGVSQSIALAQLLPLAFASSEVGRTET